MMDPLTTNGIVPALMGMFEKHDGKRAPAAGRQRKPTKAPAASGESEETIDDMWELGGEAPKHTLDDLV
jgi:hypothetical protein